MHLPPDLALSDDVAHKLSIYHDLLIKWQKKINLVAPSTVPQAWKRHFLDSLGFVSVLESIDVGSLVDLGAGAGFPSLVIAICQPDISVVAIESDERKSIFMQTVSRETGVCNFSVCNERIEESAGSVGAADVVSARALAPLPMLLGYMHKGQRGIFAKGEAVRQEIDEAQQCFNFQRELLPHPYNRNSFLLLVSDIVAL